MAENSEIDLSQEQLDSILAPPVAGPGGYVAAENGPVDSLRNLKTDDEERLPDGDAKFEAAEHEAIAEGVYIKDIYRNLRPAKTHTIWTVKANIPWSENWRPWGAKTRDIDLTFGRIIALAGDFYSNFSDNERSPISGAFYPHPEENTDERRREGQRHRFISAVNSLIQDSDRNLIQLYGLIGDEVSAVTTAEQHAHSHDDPHIPTVANAYHLHACGIPDDAAFIKATIGGTRGSNRAESTYAWLALVNADHFGNDAIIAYSTGHGLALDFAKQAGSMSNPQDKANMLQKAYLYEAFAAHYLTDIFSAGHIRTPRKQTHCTSRLLSTLSVIPKIRNKDEYPIYDFQSNYMHNNDSATGLLVRNALGEQWIAYGDKQFKESWDIVNRARVMRCLQASVDELYDLGFEKQFNPDPKDYVALKLVPQQTLSYESGPSTSWLQDWGGYDMHNPAPLWVVPEDLESDPQRSRCSYRANINDHSVFKRLQGFVEGSISLTSANIPAHLTRIQKASFRSSDQFPISGPIQGLQSGGFLQIQDLNPSLGKRTCVNFWTPAEVSMLSKTHETFTLRNRIIDFDAQPSSDSTVPLHWLKWHNGEHLSVIRMDLDVLQGSIAASVWNILDGKPTESGLRPTLSLNKSENFTHKNVFYRKTLLSQGNKDVTSSNLNRFLVGTFSPNSTSAKPDIVAFVTAEGKSVRVGVLPTEGTLTAIEHSLSFNGVPNFVKPWIKSGSKSCALLARIKGSFLKTSIASFGQTLSETEKDIPLPAGPDACVLVGDVLNRGSSQLVVVSGGDNFSVSVWGSKQETANLELVSQAENLVTVPTQTLPYFHALLPTVDATGLVILKLSLHVNNGKPSLLFRLSQYSAESGSWTTNTQLIEDSLADNRRYFHLKWIRCRYETSVHETDNALLEVFSYYGMIGIRLFASEDSNRPWAYKEVGQQQYLGQTSIGAGLGAYGDWAQGILTWGSQSQDFADLTEWIPDGSVNHSGGSWGMRQGDTNRAHIPGWDVTRRPGYYEEEGRET